MAGFIMTRRTFNLYLRMAGMRTMTSRIVATRSTMSGAKTRRRSSSNVGEAWVTTKAVTKQQGVSERLEEIQTIKPSPELPGSVEMKTLDTDL